MKYLLSCCRLPVVSGWLAKPRASRAGLASLPTVVALTLLILAIGIGITIASFTEVFTSASALQSTKALSYAEAGARDALIRVARNKNYVCSSPTSGCYTMDFVTNGCAQNLGCARITVSSSTPKIIWSEGRVSSNIRRIQVSVTLDAQGNGQIATSTWSELTN
ncbi:MAG: hypothetical protein V1856_00525 [Candidatus Liptonbacteria bacterium]